MCKRAGCAAAVTVYLLGNHVFLECICSVLPEDDSPVQTADDSVIGLEWNQHLDLNTIQILFGAKSVRSTIHLKGYTQQEASLSQPPAPCTTATIIRS